jgi:hypothetical protein
LYILLQLHIFQGQQVSTFADVSYFYVIFLYLFYWCLCYELDDSEFRTQQGQEIFSSPKCRRPALGPTQYHVWWILFFFCRDMMFITDTYLKKKVKNERIYTSVSLCMRFWHGHGQICFYILLVWLTLLFLLILIVTRISSSSTVSCG